MTDKILKKNKNINKYDLKKKLFTDAYLPNHWFVAL